MAHVLGDRVKETTTTTGTGTLALAGAASQFRAFSAVLANNDTTLYAIVGQTGTEWEVGIGTWTTGNNLARTTVIASSNSGSAVDLSSGTKDVFITFTTAGPIGTLAAGTATHPPLKLQSGTLLTTAEDGAIEMDGDNLYATVDASNRGIVPVVHYIRAASDQTLTNSTNPQNIFDSPANGQITLETGTYFFESLGIITGMSGSSGNGQFLFGGTGTFGGWMWRISGLDNTTPSTIADDDAVYLQSATGAAASTFAAGTGTALRWDMRGSFECTGAGTLIPQIDLVTGAAATVEEGSYFMVYRMGATATTSVGQWD